MTDIRVFITLLQKRSVNFMTCNDLDCMDQNLGSLITTMEHFVNEGSKEAKKIKKNMAKLKIYVEREKIEVHKAKEEFEHIAKEIAEFVHEILQQSNSE